MTWVAKLVTIITLATLSQYVFGETGWEANATIKFKAESVGFEGSNAWFVIQHRDNWDASNNHNSEHWQTVIGTSTANTKYGVGYRYVTEDTSTEHRPFVFFTPKTSVGDFSISARSKLEYRIRDNKQDGFRYRIKPKIGYRVYVGSTTTTTIFIGNEITYDMTDGDWGSNKIEAGLAIKIYNNYIIKPFYEYEFDIPSGIKSESQFGANLVYTF